MKNFDTRAYSINDFIQWNETDQLVLSPKFQRKEVWSEKAKSYLIDTIIRGKPIPKVFIRQILNAMSRKTVREVVDGQQRLRAILAYMNDGFVISKTHNKKFGGLYFSELSTVDPDIQNELLNYEISVDLLTNISDGDVLDIFARLNSYAVPLNEQEKIHARHFSLFKLMVEDTAHELHDFWIDNKIISNSKILRMEDVALCSELYIGMLDGIQTKKSVAKYYEKYEKDDIGEAESHDLKEQFINVIDIISEIFSDNLKNSNFKRIHVFYSLFLSIYHLIYGLKDIDSPPRIDLTKIKRIENNLSHVDTLFDDSTDIFSEEDEQFINDCRRATTDKTVRIRRSQYLVDIIGR
ncbi:DUF262 domain-containing protein [Enterobacter asburiae]|uniref:DUF262 domain-containing protein n=1 Tax=Enterobacter asburiae TaxID=61645 RepID=UPI00192C1ECE|nr:DUF262 domain-containing protein [Enterobacter asburiae]MBL5926625.1 DUF262 domain-containing protein [Enterobacter asburiae]MBL5957411.1 DUF262 domain-containing protein [Enterobacter asburiae]